MIMTTSDPTLTDDEQGHMLRAFISGQLHVWQFRVNKLDNAKTPKEQVVAERMEFAKDILDRVNAHHNEKAAKLQQRIAELEGEMANNMAIQNDGVVDFDPYFVVASDDRVGLASMDLVFDGERFLIVKFGPDGLHEQAKCADLTPATRADVLAAELDVDAGRILGEDDA